MAAVSAEHDGKVVKKMIPAPCLCVRVGREACFLPSVSALLLGIKGHKYLFCLELLDTVTKYCHAGLKVIKNKFEHNGREFSESEAERQTSLTFTPVFCTHSA